MDNPQKRATENFRLRLGERGLSRFEVIGRDADRALIRSFARHLADGKPGATELRAAVNRTVTGELPPSGGILAALRRSPIMGADLDLGRPHDDGRKSSL